MKNHTKTEQILSVMKILAWVAFIGFMIQAGAILVSFGVSFVNPLAAKDLYQGMNFYNLRQFSIWEYTNAVSFTVAIAGMKAYIAYKVIKILSKINLVNPFKMEVAKQLERVSYLLFATWLIGTLSSAHMSWLMKRTGELFGTSVSTEFLFMASLVFIISQIFKRGVEIQSENDLTI